MRGNIIGWLIKKTALSLICSQIGKIKAKKRGNVIKPIVRSFVLFVFNFPICNEYALVISGWSEMTKAWCGFIKNQCSMPNLNLKTTYSFNRSGKNVLQRRFSFWMESTDRLGWLLASSTLLNKIRGIETIGKHSFGPWQVKCWNFSSTTML